MAKKRVLLHEDSRWPEFCELFAADIVLFAVEVLGLTPTHQQIELFRSVAPSRSRTSVASGHGTGKTSGTSIIVLWHLLCFPMSVTLITANDMDQLQATMWKEIGTNIERIRQSEQYGWIADHIQIIGNTNMRIIGYGDTWFVESKTANAKSANKMAGRHGEWLLVIVDEASTVPDEVLATLRGALTEEHNRMLMNSQPTRNSGFFWRTHNDLSIANGGDWNNLVFSSVVSPLVSDAALLSLWDEYDDDERRVRILGLFPKDSSKLMMSLDVAMKMYTRGRIINEDEAYGFFVISDVASGEGLRDKSTITCVRVIGYGDRGDDARRIEVFKIPLFTNSVRANTLHNSIYEEVLEHSNALAVVDSGGLGVQVCQNLEDLNCPTYRVMWGNTCFMNSNKDRYLNLRAQASHQAARAAKEGRISVLTGDYKREMLAQSSRIPKAFTDKAKIKVPPKHSAEWNGMGSPDLWDTICFCFLEGLQYIPAEKAAVKQKLSDKIESAALEAFSDIT